MRILQNLSRGELDFYTKQPTAKKLLEKVRRDGINVPPGDNKAAAAYMAGRSTADSGQDEVEISAAGYSLQVQEQATDRQAEKPMPHMSAELTVDLGAEMPVAGEAEAVLSE